MNWTEWRKNALLLTGVMLTMLAAAEMGLRLARPQPTYSDLLAQVEKFYAPSAYNTFQLKNNYSGVEPSMEFPGTNVPVGINSAGFRGRELQGDKSTVVVMGDSYTFGVYVGDDETYPAVLDARIRERYPQYQVVNAGFADGFETDQHYVWLKHNMQRLEPRIVILGAYPGNDILGINPNAWVDLDDRGLPGRWIAEDLNVAADGVIRSKSKGVTDLLGIESAYGVPLLRESHLFILAGKAFDKMSRKLTGEQGSVEYRLQHLFGVYSDEFIRKEAIFLELVGAMQGMCDSRGTRFVVALLPINFMVEPEKLDRVLPGSRFRGRESVYYARLERLLAAKGIRVLNIESEMKRAGPGPYFPANGEVHFNPRGHAFTAGKLFEFLSAANDLR